MPVPAPVKTPAMSRAGSNLSKPGSRQTPKRTATQNKTMDIGDPDFDKAMSKQLSSLEKKKTNVGARPRLGATEAPKLGSSPAKTVPDILINQASKTAEQEKPAEVEASQEQPTEEDNQKAPETEHETKKECAKQNKDDYSDDFESDDEIIKVRDENQKFVQEKFEEHLRALSQASELPNVDDEEFENYISDQKFTLQERTVSHNIWLKEYQEKKENLLHRLGVLFRNRLNRFNEVTNIACEALGVDPLAPRKQSRRNSVLSEVLSRSQSTERSVERGRSRSRDRGRSRERSRDRSRGQSRERSQGRSRERTKELLPEIVDIKEEITTVN